MRHQTRVLSASLLGCSCLLSGKCRLTWCLGTLPSCSTFNCSFFFSPSSGNLQELASWSLKDSTLPSPSLCSHSPLAISAVCKVSRAYISIRLPLQLLEKKKKFPYLFSKSFMDVMSTPPIQNLHHNKLRVALPFWGDIVSFMFSFSCH